MASAYGKADHGIKRLALEPTISFSSPSVLRDNFWVRVGLERVAVWNDQVSLLTSFGSSGRDSHILWSPESKMCPKYVSLWYALVGQH